MHPVKTPEAYTETNGTLVLYEGVLNISEVFILQCVFEKFKYPVKIVRSLVDGPMAADE